MSHFSKSPELNRLEMLKNAAQKNLDRYNRLFKQGPTADLLKHINETATRVLELHERIEGLYAKEKAQNGLEKSKGHVEFIGPFEYFYGANGDLFRAPKNSPMDVSGYRMGARFESTPVAAEQCLKIAREYFEKQG